jgi:cytochrome c oxidase subunit 3
METKPVDHTGIKLGMWLFLYTEIMLFSGLFILYAAYYNRYLEDFIQGGRALDLFMGVFNTIILLISSFTVAASITAIRKHQAKLSAALVGVTMLLGLVFLVNKYFEWGHKIHEGIYPGSATLVDGPTGQNIFFGLYYVITGLHGLHIVAGLTVLGWSLIYLKRGRIRPDRFALLDNAGLYWHLVDLIWIFIFPLFYLIL